jgi:hypothetical protein
VSHLFHHEQNCAALGLQRVRRGADFFEVFILLKHVKQLHKVGN